MERRRPRLSPVFSLPLRAKSPGKAGPGPEAAAEGGRGEGSPGVGRGPVPRTLTPAH